MSFLETHYVRQTVRNDHLGADFVAQYLRALGARVESRGASLLRAELTRDQVCELENRPGNTWYSTNSIPELTTMYLALDPHIQVEEERAESAAPGSWRFSLMQDSVRRIGAVTRMRVAPHNDALDIVYRPILIFGFEVSYLCSRRTSHLLPVAVDMVTGTSGKELALQLLARQLDEQPVHIKRQRPRELRYKHAFEVACEWVKESIAHEETLWDWYYRASYRLATELAQVEEFFSQRDQNGEGNLEEERMQAVLEIRKRFEPRVEGRSVLGIVALCPEHELPHI